MFSPLCCPIIVYGKCPKIMNKVSDKMAYANSADPDQTAPVGQEQSDQGLHCLPFY